MPLMPLILSPSRKCSAHLRHPAKPGRLRLGKAGSSGKDGRPSKPVKLIPEGFSWQNHQNDQNHHKNTTKSPQDHQEPRQKPHFLKLCAVWLAWFDLLECSFSRKALSCWTLFRKTKTWSHRNHNQMWSCLAHPFAFTRECMPPTWEQASRGGQKVVKRGNPPMQYLHVCCGKTRSALLQCASPAGVEPMTNLGAAPYPPYNWKQIHNG